MKYSPSRIILTLAFIVVAGCGKKTENVAPPAPPAAAAPAPAPVAASTATPNPAPNPVVVQNVSQSLLDADAALKAKAYEKAVQTMLAVQRQNLSAEQAQRAADQMRGLQASLAAAIAAGDPAARAAADQLRHAHQ